MVGISLLKLCPKQVAVLTSLWISAENVGSFLGAIGGGAAYDRYRLVKKKQLVLTIENLSMRRLNSHIEVSLRECFCDF